MPHYYRLGEIPHKRHTQFRKADGGLYAEQLISTEGFSDVYTLAYHLQAPTGVLKIEEPYSVAPEAAIENNMQHRSLSGFKIKPDEDYLKSRVPVLFNNDVCLYLAAPSESQTKYFFKNSQGDEVIFIHEGSGVLKTNYGNLPFKYGDHLVIPRGTIYQIHFETSENRLFIIESYSPVHYPKRYINKMGQLLEHAPYCERDIHPPQSLETHDQDGDFLVHIKRDNLIFPYHMKHHPFNLIGWDGYHYPFSFSIHDFEPITGRVHQPPTVHQSFEAHNFVICAFVPRKYDYHPNAIPAPYNHSNVDSDEVLYYVDGDFMSRKSVERGQITLHPTGIPHGPHPGAVEKSIGAERTDELAVMVDTFKPLKLTKQALDIEDENYFKSWIE
jgi:homogentisate 1,2-dioxygenase